MAGRPTVPSPFATDHYGDGGATCGWPVRQRFQAFQADLNLTPAQLNDGIGKAIGVGKALERAYNGAASEQPPIFFVGSWGKGTQVRPSNDVDIMVTVDWRAYQRFEARSGNKQSQLLQEGQRAPCNAVSADHDPRRRSGDR